MTQQFVIFYLELWDTFYLYNSRVKCNHNYKALQYCKAKIIYTFHHHLQLNMHSLGEKLFTHYYYYYYRSQIKFFSSKSNSQKFQQYFVML